MNDKQVVAKYIRDALSEIYWITSSVDDECEFISKEESEKIQELQDMLKDIYKRINR